ncbi:hypothetical protein M5K25_014769 [Dendrobium thyrsiflorum]|uniref:Uncharacterized protein n=1 Tax=Dendrobium thyrsiflorum TaxID=117978 RepID=A0ABD0UPC5_DENTH
MTRHTSVGRESSSSSSVSPILSLDIKSVNLMGCLKTAVSHCSSRIGFFSSLISLAGGTEEDIQFTKSNKKQINNKAKANQREPVCWRASGRKRDHLNSDFSKLTVELNVSEIQTNDIKFNSMRAQMSPNQRSKAPLETSIHNLSYQTVSKHDVLIVKSSDSTRRSQRSQDHWILISLRYSNAQ